jgi:hypothetical protein
MTFGVALHTGVVWWRDVVRSVLLLQATSRHLFLQQRAVLDVVSWLTALFAQVPRWWYVIASLLARLLSGCNLLLQQWAILDQMSWLVALVTDISFRDPLNTLCCTFFHEMARLAATMANISCRGLVPDSLGIPEEASWVILQ